jgi:hypothetical protein
LKSVEEHPEETWTPEAAEALPEQILYSNEGFLMMTTGKRGGLDPTDLMQKAKAHQALVRKQLRWHRKAKSAIDWSGKEDYSREGKFVKATSLEILGSGCSGVAAARSFTDPAPTTKGVDALELKLPGAPQTQHLGWMLRS